MPRQCNATTISSVLSRLIPKADRKRLFQFYGGQRCVLTLSNDVRGGIVDWAHLITHSGARGLRQLEKLKRLSLCREDLVPESSENIIPLDRSFHGLFGRLAWGIFPTIDVLHKHIHAEELWWRHRELAFRERGLDVGRPPFVGNSTDVNTFDVHWSNACLPVFMRFPTPDVPVITTPDSMPAIKLIAGVPNVIVTCLPHLAKISSLTPHARDAFDLGVYLQALWNRTPDDDNRVAPRRPTILPKWDLSDVTPYQAPSLPSTVSQSRTSTRPPSSREVERKVLTRGTSESGGVEQEADEAHGEFLRASTADNAKNRSAK